VGIATYPTLGFLVGWEQVLFRMPFLPIHVDSL